MPTLPFPPEAATRAGRATGTGPPLLVARDALPAGSRLAEFRIVRVLGRGAFGIVYLAHDHTLGRQVAIKEYLPAMWAGRSPDGQVTVRCTSCADDFAAGLASFVHEARWLARFDHPSLVKVHRFWEGQGTAYMVMPYHQGVSLRHLRESMGEAPTEAWLRRLLDGLLGALEVMHRASVLHRDVAPDNILVLPSGVPVLLDFGAAREVLRGQPQALTAILKPSYAPIEQYAADSEVRQGPWTDIYAVAATLHYALTGMAPCTSAARVVHDTQARLCQSERFVAAYDRPWLEALDWGLALMPHQRPQGIVAWQQALDGRTSVPRAASPQNPVPATGLETAPVATALPAVRSARPARRRRVAVAAVGLVVLGLAWWSQDREPAVPMAVSAAGAPTTAPTTALVLPPAPEGPAEPAFEMARPVAMSDAPVAAAGPIAAVPAQPAPLRARPAARVTRAKAAPVAPPLQQCERLGWLARINCMRKACAAPQWTRHPQCVPEERLGRRAPEAAAPTGLS